MCGRSCTGKDSIVKAIQEQHKFNRVVTFTTRDKRPNETNDIDYHFITKEEFDNSLKWYAKHPDELQLIYRKVLDKSVDFQYVWSFLLFQYILLHEMPPMSHLAPRK